MPDIPLRVGSRAVQSIRRKPACAAVQSECVYPCTQHVFMYPTFEHSYNATPNPRARGYTRRTNERVYSFARRSVHPRLLPLPLPLPSYLISVRSLILSRSRRSRIYSYLQETQKRRNAETMKPPNIHVCVGRPTLRTYLTSIFAIRLDTVFKVYTHSAAAVE